MSSTSRARGLRAPPPTLLKPTMRGLASSPVRSDRPTGPHRSRPNVADPGYRAVTFDQLRSAYGEQVRGLLDGGADILLVETIFDTLNAKAALYAICEVCEERGRRVPIMISGTITDRSGRLLSGQTPTAFWHSVAHAQPLSIGFNCALGARELRAHVAEMAQVADTLVCAYPNAGLPNAFGRYDESAPVMGGLIEEFATAGLVNIVGGCCGTTPAHIRAIARAVDGKAPRVVPQIAPRLRLVGPRAVHAHAGNSVREYRRAHQRHRLGALPQADQGRRLRWRRSRSRAIRSRTAPRSSTSTWTKASSIRKPPW